MEDIIHGPTAQHFLHGLGWVGASAWRKGGVGANGKWHIAHGTWTVDGSSGQGRFCIEGKTAL